ncbi:MAG: tetratricopeptide repeat protein [Bacteriovoracaceae bacterium]|jgi:hypothetical protein|nr:hypothetical protein [Halobacteriovoraceae bacterium]MDP7320750.1 tetratricopeptide repeat protein [Bacteriovoracaceae bacterium]
MKLCFNFLTFFLLCTAFASNLFAQSLVQKSEKSYLRWTISSLKEQLKINKSQNKVILQSIDAEFFEKLSEDIAKISRKKDYHSSFRFFEPKVPGDAYKLEVVLKDNSIELFNFYKSDQQAYILDFWVNQDVVAVKEAAVQAPPKVAKLNTPPTKTKTKPRAKKKTSDKVEKVLAVDKTARLKVINPEEVISNQSSKGYRDFRYGAAFLWNYDAFIPPLADDISLNIKAPDFLYHIKDREYLADKKQAHMQLNINFYRKEQWGLMTRSIKLYEEKYGRDNNKNLNDFMKAVSMIKNVIKTKIKPVYSSKMDEAGDIVPAKDFSKAGVLAAARNILTNIIDSSEDYELNKAVLRYLIQYSKDEKDYIQALNYAKSLYVKASEDFDDEMIIYSSKVILNSLANLKQIEKIKEFLGNKAVMRVLPKQVGLAYISYVHLYQDETSQVIAQFKTNQASLVKPIHPSILFNTAESFFRQGEYKKAVKLFDELIDKYSSLTKTGQARLRIALSYDLLNEDVDKTLRLYQDAINKSSDLKTRYEAKMRYVGLRVARNKSLNDKDVETIAFLQATEGERRNLDLQLKKLLWLTRLRTMLSSEKYSEALSYLSALPLDNLRQIDQRTFHGDGAEVVLGVIQESYIKEDYARAVKLWEIYKKRYNNKVARNPYLNFIVADSYIKLGLFKSYQRVLSDLKSINEKRVRRFPLWVKPYKKISSSDYVLELEINSLLKQNDYKGLAKLLEKNKNNKNINYKFYNGLVSYHLKKYNEGVTSFESLLVKPNLNNILTPGQNLTMLKAYLESLYESSEPKVFRRKNAALTNDLRRNLRPKYKELVGRADYLYIESLFSEENINYELLTAKTEEFLADFSQSQYLMRVKYIGAVAQINNRNENKGRKLLEELLNDKNVPEYLKGLARSELSTLELKNKTI